MADIPDGLLVHRAAVYRILGENSYGEVLAESTEFPCFITHKRRLVRSANGDEVVSTATIRCNIELEEHITPESEVVLHLERTRQGGGTVIGVSPNVDGNLGAWEHLRVDV